MDNNISEQNIMIVTVISILKRLTDNQIQSLKESKNETQTTRESIIKNLHKNPYEIHKKVRDLKLIRKKCHENYITKIIEDTAKNIYKSIDTRKLRGETNRGVIAASILIACNENDTSINITKLADMFNTTSRVVGYGHRKLIELLKNKDKIK